MVDKLGLVLSGGGAKGAYQVGILQYMAEAGIQPDEVSGTSIGALNASVVSAQKDISEAAKCLEKIWKQLADIPPLQLEKNKFLTTVSLLSNLIPAAKISPLVIACGSLKGALNLSRDVYDFFSGSHKQEEAHNRYLENQEANVYKTDPIVDLLKSYSQPNEILKGLPLYVGIYKSDGSLSDSINYILSTKLGFKNKDSEFWHLQSLPESTIQDAIIASAALPFLFKAKAVNGVKYRDGGIGGAFDQQGNTPAQPLIESGCSHLIVSLLEDGSFFDRHKYPNTTIIEVRPKDFISDTFKDMLAFEPEKIDTWMKQGYEDAKRCIGNSLSAIKLKNIKNQSANLRDERLSLLDSDNFEIN
ncbi:patatin-like phospholipase family protein [Pseudoalteromonas distincta]|uniref:patatin-like phospholipase family protein n=1 Tax=Pseudoalteromonas distincta TaxID=77608 RepID=UPI00186A23B0|nr:patatin-like phospholipase family protein [Pseudoalteromonas distincta]MBE3672496.1 hypothetical protein [Pseudoalteromonas distincta KMM 3548]